MQQFIKKLEQLAKRTVKKLLSLIPERKPRENAPEGGAAGGPERDAFNIRELFQKRGKLSPGAAKRRDILTKISVYALKGLTAAFLVFVFTGVICFGAFGFYVRAYLMPEADIDVGSIDMNFTSVINYIDQTTGESKELKRLYGSENRTWVNYDKIPAHLSKAFIAIEDERFDSHKGVDWKRTFGAAANIIMPFSGNFGGSTLTQQLIKNLTGDKEVTIQRKVLEILRALEFERNYSKEQVLEMYMNTINLSQGCYGVASASYMYFGKEVSELTLAESACIAGITNSPTYYDPFQNRENNRDRQRLILRKMEELGFISEDEYQAAIEEELVFRTISEEQQESDREYNSYFVDLVINEVIGRLQSDYGYSRAIAEKMLYAGGLTIEATIDPAVQAAMEKVYEDRSNSPSVKGTTQLESAMVVMSTDGYLRGIVGGIGQKYGNLVLNRALSKRQTGSATKPVTVYAPALEYGLITPYSVFDDTPPLVIDKNGVIQDPSLPVPEGTELTPWPANSNRTYTGRITVLQAVARSTNTIAVRVLYEKGLLEKAFDFAAQNLNLSLVKNKVINNRTYSDLGYSSMSLGGQSIGLSLLELTAAYVPFVNDGVYNPYSSFYRVLDSEGEVLIDNTGRETIAMSQKTAYYMRTMLEAVVKSGGTAPAAAISGFGTAGKTGTTTSDHDRWFVGFTPYYVGGVWYGFDTPKTISGVSGNPSVNMWKKVMTELHKGKAKAGFAAPEGLQTYSYCLDSGGIPTAACRADDRGRVAEGLFFPEDAPTTVCTVHTMVRVCSTSGKLATANCPESAVKTLSKLNLFRYFAVPGVVVGDEGRTVHMQGVLSEDILARYYPAVAAGGAALEAECDIHHYTPPVTTPPATTGPATTPPETSQWEPPQRP